MLAKPGDIVINRVEQQIGTVLYTNKDGKQICVGKGRCCQQVGIITVWPMQNAHNFYMLSDSTLHALDGLFLMHSNRIELRMKPITVAKKNSICKVFKPIPRRVLPGRLGHVC